MSLTRSETLKKRFLGTRLKCLYVVTLILVYFKGHILNGLFNLANRHFVTGLPLLLVIFRSCTYIP